MVIKSEGSELKADLEQFRRSVNKLIELEDELALINEELNGNTLKSPEIKSKEESSYQKGTVIYKNNIIELMYREKHLISSRDYYLYRVKKVATLLQRLSEDEVQLLEYRYWHGFSIRTIAKLMYLSKSSVCRNLDSIFEKWDMSQQK